MVWISKKILQNKFIKIHKTCTNFCLLFLHDNFVPINSIKKSIRFNWNFCQSKLQLSLLQSWRKNFLFLQTCTPSVNYFSNTVEHCFCLFGWLEWSRSCLSIAQLSFHARRCTILTSKTCKNSRQSFERFKPDFLFISFKIYLVLWFDSL